MSGNTSASGGYLAPGASPASDDALDDILQGAVVGIVGLTGDLVRPRFQVNPPRQPEPGVDWAAIGVLSIEGDAGPSITHDDTAAGGLGADNLARHEALEVLVSFYGPNGAGNAARLRDGLLMPQNLEVLKSNLLAYVNSDIIRKVPELVGERWIARYDVTLHFRRKVERSYQVENILSAAVSIDGAPVFIITS